MAEKNMKNNVPLHSRLVGLSDKINPLGGLARDIGRGVASGVRQGVTSMMGRTKADADMISAALADQPKKRTPQSTPSPKPKFKMPQIGKKTPKGMAKGGSVASKRGDGCATKGKTRGKMV